MLADITKLAYRYKDDIKDDLTKLIAIPSWEDKKTSSEEMPFGQGISDTFKYMKELCIREGLSVSSVGGYAFHSDWGNNPSIGFATHLDTVPINDKNLWDTSPLQLLEKNDHWIGLGVNDNKGSAILGIYAVKIIQQIAPKTKIRLIFGGAEETSWKCMEKYLQQYTEPDFVIVPDGNFPLVMVEKGTLRFTLSIKCPNISSLTASFEQGICCEKVSCVYHGENKTFRTKRTPSRHPYRSKNALSILAEVMPQHHIWKLLTLLDDGLGNKVGLSSQNQDIEKNICNTFAFTSATLEEGHIFIHGDIRYMTQKDKANVLEFFNDFCKNEGILFTVTKEYPLINKSINDKEINILYKTYQEVSGDYTSEPLIMGAMSYARAFKRAIAFGPCFPKHDSKSHRANENMPIDDIIKSLIIYTNSLILLNNIYCK